MILSTDGQTDKVIPVYPPINFAEAGGIITNIHFSRYFQIVNVVNRKSDASGNVYF